MCFTTIYDDLLSRMLASPHVHKPFRTASARRADLALSRNRYVCFGKPDGDRLRSPHDEESYGFHGLPSPHSHAGAASYGELEAYGQTP